MGEITDASTCLPVVILVPTTMAKDAEDQDCDEHIKASYRTSIQGSKSQ